jgi:hypothetical protein
MLYEEIYQRFLGFCRPYSLVGLWREFQVPTDLWSPPADSSAALSDLRQQFDHDELRKAGITSGNPGDPVALAPVLCDPQTIILALREQVENAPFELVLNEGSLSGRLPVCAAMQDARVQEAAATAGSLALTFSMEDLAALGLMGIPAMPAHGLAHIRRQTLREFCGCLQTGWSPADQQHGTSSTPAQELGIGTEQTDPAPESDVATEFSTVPVGQQSIGTPLELIFVGWSPAKLERLEPPQLEDIVPHFRAIEQYLEIPMGDVYLWRPRQEDVERITFCLRNADREFVREALLASMDRSTTPITARKPVKSAPKDLPETILQLEKVLHGPARDDLEQNAWQEYEQQVNGDLAMPLLQLAMTVADPVRRNLMATTAGIARVLHPQAMLIAAKITKRIGKSGLGKTGRVPEKDMRNLMEMTDRLIHLNEELQRCKRIGKTRSRRVRL